MTRQRPAASTAIGFRVKSGWAAAVLLGGPADAPQALGRAVLELSDPAVAESRQPYHASTGREETDAARIDKRVAVVRRAARENVPRLIAQLASVAAAPPVAGLVVGSLIEPEKIANPHIRAHACEGRLFRTVLAEALSAAGIDSLAVVEREIYSRAADSLARNEAAIKQALVALGRPLGKPWGGNEKLAALAAWLALAGAPTP
jgi:hypothetical protein